MNRVRFLVVAVAAALQFIGVPASAQTTLDYSFASTTPIKLEGTNNSIALNGTQWWWGTASRTLSLTKGVPYQENAGMYWATLSNVGVSGSGQVTLTHLLSIDGNPYNFAQDVIYSFTSRAIGGGTYSSSGSFTCKAVTKTIDLGSTGILDVMLPEVTFSPSSSGAFGSGGSSGTFARPTFLLRESTTPAAVPEGPSFLLFLPALCLVALLRRRRMSERDARS